MKSQSTTPRATQTSARRLPLILLAAALSIPAGALLVRGANAYAEDPAPAPAVSAAEIAKLVAQLGDEDFRVRENASRALAKIGEQARKALTHAADNDKSLETRWRAQQLLRRLTKTQPKAVDPDEPKLVPDNPLGNNPFGNEEEMERFRRGIEEFRKRFEGLRRNGSGLGTLLGAGKVKAPGLELIRGPEGVTLIVIDESGAGAEARTKYSGATLDAILKANPELQKHAAMAELKAKSKDPLQRLRELIGGRLRVAPGMGGVTTITSGSGVAITQDANGARVKITEPDADGNPVTKEYTGKDLDEIRRKYPEIADKLGGTSIEFRFVKPKIFGLQPPVVTPGQAPTAVIGGPHFGVSVKTPGDLLAMHLGLAKGHGAIILQVVEGGQAAAMGVERGDIIVSVNQQPVATIEQLVRRLRQAAQNKAELTLEIIRRGKRQTLTR